MSVGDAKNTWEGHLDSSMMHLFVIPREPYQVLGLVPARVPPVESLAEADRVVRGTVQSGTIIIKCGE